MDFFEELYDAIQETDSFHAYVDNDLDANKALAELEALAEDLPGEIGSKITRAAFNYCWASQKAAFMFALTIQGALNRGPALLRPFDLNLLRKKAAGK